MGTAPRCALDWFKILLMIKLVNFYGIKVYSSGENPLLAPRLEEGLMERHDYSASQGTHYCLLLSRYVLGTRRTFGTQSKGEITNSLEQI